MWLGHYFCLSLRKLTGGVTAVHAMISAYSRSPDEVTRTPRPGTAASEKDPGCAFGPKSVPLATGSVSVVYWAPGPFPRPTPVQIPVQTSVQIPVQIPVQSSVQPEELRGPARTGQQPTADPADVNRGTPAAACPPPSVAFVPRERIFLP